MTMCFQIYADNKAYVAQHMKEYAEGKHTFTVALNKFADFTSAEFSRIFKGLKMGSTIPHAIHQVRSKAIDFIICVCNLRLVACALKIHLI